MASDSSVTSLVIRMGLPDHYDTEYKNADNQSPEFWDRDGCRRIYRRWLLPYPYTPWQKMLMGWATPITLDGYTGRTGYPGAIRLRHQKLTR